jgi:uncharacterized membrane protein (UPF0127 family)
VEVAEEEARKSTGISNRKERRAFLFLKNEHQVEM